jgi:acyl-CoA synthetase
VALEAVQAHLAASGLAKQKWPEDVRVVEAFDRTPSGKIRKRTLRDALRAEAPATPPEPPAPPRF